MAHPLGTLLASPIVTGSALDEYGTHYSHLGIGGWQEVENINKRNSIPIDSVNGLDDTGLSSGRRRVGMSVYCIEEDIVYQLKISNFNNLSEIVKVSELSNNNNWVVLSTGGSSGDSIKRRYTESGHTFSEGDVVAFDGTNYVKAIASINGSDNVVGIVSGVVNANEIDVTYMGYYDVTGLGLTNNTLYFLSPDTAGSLTDVEPTIIGQISKPVVLIQSNGDSIVLNYPSIIIDEAKESSGTRIQKKIIQISHGFSEGDVIGNDGSSYVYTIAQSNTTIEALGVIIDVIDVNSFVLCYSGYVDSITGMTDSSSNSLSGNTKYYLSDTVAGKITAIKPTNIGTVVRPVLITLTETNGNVVQYQGNVVTSGSTGTVAGVIGPAEFSNTYDDGIYEDFSQTTPTGTPIDRFNRLLKSLAPTPPPQLSTINRIGGGTFTSAELSFGSANNDLGYVIVDGSGGTTSNINDTFSVSGNRLGATNASSVTLKLNGNVGGNANYESGAFADGDKGLLVIELNGVSTSVALSGTTAAINQGNVSLSEVKDVTFDNGDPATFFRYRTGSVTISNASFNDGYNYLRVRHQTLTFTGTTSYVEWVYDSNAIALAINGTPSFSSVSLTGSKFISGVEYNTSGSVLYSVSVDNVYKNVYQTGSAIGYINRTRLSDATTISKSSTGDGINSENSSSKNLPLLNGGGSDPVLDTLDLVSTHTINSNVLGFGSTGTIATGVQIGHPFKATLSDGNVSSQGYLVYQTTLPTDLENENFIGENYRLENRDYSTLTYNDVNGGTYDWNGVESLIGANGLHNNGLLVFNGELMYPNSSRLSSEYGINDGNFGTVTTPVGNPNYTTASGERIYNRLFKSNNTTNQGSLIIEIDYTGNSSDFLLDLENGGTTSGNNIKLEFLILRADNVTKYGWSNPFAVFSDSNGYQRESLNVVGDVITITTNLDVNPFGENDIVLLRFKASSGWTQRIKNLKINNI